MSAEPLRPQAIPRELVTREANRLSQSRRAGDLNARTDALELDLADLRIAASAGNDFRVQKFAEIDSRFAALEAREAATLEKRLAAELERIAQFRDCGVWDESTQYENLNVVSHDGSMWLAQRSSLGERPGSGDAFRLAVKHGRNGRDAR